ncbi:VOC family protein [Nocardia wallacei]|uniref:VOC family protein n=1 Tax=Nocardia wallacei TaxID=480035 RepID=UPI0024556974|nr:VOC family protein [Nocardia wallacei]
MTHDINGIHHCGILTRDLDSLERRFASLGFTLSPRSRHLLSEGPGTEPIPGCTANRCALFGNSYIELLGIVDEDAPDPWHTRTMPDGFRILNFDTGDAEVTQQRITALGLHTSGVLDLEREVDTENGPRMIRARAVHVDPRTTSEGYVGIAQHLTRKYVHQSRYLNHLNGARGLSAVLIVADDDIFDGLVGRYAGLLGAPPRSDGTLTVVEMAAGRVELVRSSMAEVLLPGEPVPAPSYLAAMTIAVEDVAAARAIVGRAGTPTRPTDNGGFFVSARDAFGAGLFFTAATDR